MRMTREEAKEVFLNRGWIEVDGGTIYNGDKWRESCLVISEWLKEQKSRKGHWKHIQYEDTLCCSECGCRLVDEQTYIPLHYCPNCGARMAESEGI